MDATGSGLGHISCTGADSNESSYSVIWREFLAELRNY